MVWQPLMVGPRRSATTQWAFQAGLVAIYRNPRYEVSTAWANTWSVVAEHLRGLDYESD